MTTYIQRRSGAVGFHENAVGAVLFSHAVERLSDAGPDATTTCSLERQTHKPGPSPPAANVAAETESKIITTDAVLITVRIIPDKKVVPGEKQTTLQTRFYA